MFANTIYYLPILLPSVLRKIDNFLVSTILES